jgi:hypothetical protein
LARGNVAPGGAVELAEGYPAEDFVAAGKILPDRGGPADRVRTLKDVTIPQKLLRKGVNVVAIELVHAPYNKIVDEKKGDPKRKPLGLASCGCAYDLSWNTCQMIDVTLTAAAGDGAVLPNVGRPPQMQVWNSDPLAPDSDSDLADRCEPLRPVLIQGVANGWFSGKIVVASPKAIAGLQATVTELKGPATIPASALRVRYATVWPDERNRETLLEAPLQVFPVGRNGTVVPIWVTLKVPAEAKAGTYTGQITIAAKGEKTVVTPVKLEVADWALPEQSDWRTWVELDESPDTLALEYNVPLWSDKHWELISQSMRYIGEMGSRTVHVPLICHTNFGNAESMVRWIKKADGAYDWDFSIMDKYLDLAQKYMGKPKIVVFATWEQYLQVPTKEVKVTEADKKDSWVYAHVAAAAAKWDMRDKGPAVTALDPASGQTAQVNLPRYEEPAAKAAWKPLFDELHKRMAKRGLEDTMMLGMASDEWPSQAELATLQEVSGRLPWFSHTHGGNRVGSSLRGLAPLKYIAFVWNNVYAPDPSQGHTYGWKRPDLHVEYMRFGALNDWPLSSVLYIEEQNITGQQRGMGRIGADFWPVIKDKKGTRRGWVVDRFPESYWHNLNLTSHLLLPGPDGPVATPRYEAFREGIEQCEARIAIERVLTDEALKAKLGPELARKSQDVLDDRLRDIWHSCSGLQLTGREYATSLPNGDLYGGWAGYCWFLGSDWRNRTQSFYALAGEVARKANGK